MVASFFLPRCTTFFNRIPIESLKTCYSNAMHLGKNSSPPSLAQSSIHRKNCFIATALLQACLVFICKVPRIFFVLLDWIGLDWIGLDWIGLDLIGLDLIGLDLIGLDWTRLMLLFSL